MVDFSDWEKIQLKIGEVKEVEEIEGADKLYKLTVDIGEDESRTLCAGIKKYYSKDELIGKKIVVFANLEPRKLRGIESQGMLLAAGSKEEDNCTLLVPLDDKIPNGSKIS